VIVEPRILRTLLLWATIICPAIAIIAGLFAPSWPVQRGLLFYIAPLFFIGPLWLRLRVAQRPLRLDAGWVVDLAVFGLAVLRFTTGNWLPFSGHMLFLSYSTLVTPSLRYRLLAVALALETAWFKFGLWHDPRTFWIGVGIGAVAALAYAVLVPKQAT
jgi:hypothetical protein